MKIGLVSLGCPKNLVDSEVMLGLAQQAGHELTNDPAAADVLVVNTCAFIDNAKQESIDTILEMAQQKRDGKCSRLVVTGCLAERYRDELRQEIPEIDALLGAVGGTGVVFAPSASGFGTNAAVLSPPLLMPLKFGEPSFDNHLLAARQRGLSPAVLELPGIGLDIDTPEDLEALLARGSATRSAALLSAWGFPARLSTRR